MNFHVTTTDQGEQVRTSEHTVKAPSAKTGFFATLGASRRVSGDVRGSGASSHRPAFLAIPFTAALLALLAIVALAAAALAPAAQAAKGVVGSFGEQGTTGGQFENPGGVAVNDSTGDVYVADSGNNRIEQFSASGNFVRAWGWDVALGVPA